jgi:hypothetical protein
MEGPMAGLKPGTEEPEPEAATEDFICPSCGVGFTAKGKTACPTCGAAVKDADDPIPASEMGQGKLEVDDLEGKKVAEGDLSPFDKYVKNSVKILKENNF